MRRLHPWLESPFILKSVALTVAGAHPQFTHMQRFIFPLTIFLAAASLCAQGAATPVPAGELFGWWAARTNVIQSRQPNWAVPLVTTYTGLFQVVRTDIVRQTTPALTQTWNLDNSKGVNLILSNWTEVAVDLPPFIRHNSAAADGFGDMSFLGKVRLVSGNAQHGDYVVSVFALATIPTGSYKNGSTDATIAPNLGIGKGFGRFDVQSTLGATLPSTNQPSPSLAIPLPGTPPRNTTPASSSGPRSKATPSSSKGARMTARHRSFSPPAS